MKAGCLTEPPVSVPSAATHISAATAAADPPDVPPDTLILPYGFTTGQNAEFSLPEPIANSSRFVFHIIHPPAASSLVKQVALYGGIKFSAILEANVVLTHCVRMRSFTAIGAHLNSQSLSVVILF
jgi:hypothetical protein